MELDYASKFSSMWIWTPLTTTKEKCERCFGWHRRRNKRQTKTYAGIEKENLPKLFHEFEQLSDSNERITGGSGLGLVISRRIIEENNGKIWAESESGKGTTFYFELPVQKKKALATAKQS